MTAGRLEPLPPEHTPELKPLFDSFRRTLGFVPNSALTMQRKPKLLQAFVALQAALWEPDSRVDRGLKRLIAHVAARVAGCRYCQAQQAARCTSAWRMPSSQRSTISAPARYSRRPNGPRSSLHSRRAQSPTA